jgi:protein TonB
LVVVAVAWFAREQLLKEDPRDRRVAQRVRLLDAPKPPPPPKVEDKPLEVKEEKEVEVRDAAPPGPGPEPAGDRLGLDADAAGTGDAFGLTARRGGRDITTIGSEKPTGAGGTSWVWYGAVIKRHLEGLAGADRRLGGRSFRMVVQLWVAPDGRVTRFDIVGSSGSDDVDRVMRELLAAAPPLRELPPQDMPQPIRLRVTSRPAG